MSTQNAPSGFGPNDWLVEEMYERFLEDPGSVDTAWHEFFADYSPDKSESSRPTGDQLNNIKDRLLALKVGEISTFRYDSVIDDILDYDVVSVKSEPFYFEINEAISAEINPSQLLLVR